MRKVFLRSLTKKEKHQMGSYTLYLPVTDKITLYILLPLEIKMECTKMEMEDKINQLVVKTTETDKKLTF